MTKVNEHLSAICKKDETLFENKVLYFIEGVNFHDLWHSSDATDNNKNAVWKFLQILSLLGSKCIPNKKEILDMLEKVGGVIEEPEKLRETLEKPIVIDPEEKESEPFGIQNLIKSLGGLSGLAGNGDASGLGEGFQGIMQMAQSLSESLKDVDMSKLQEQMSETFKDLESNNAKNAEPTTSETGDSNSDTTDDTTGTSTANNLFSELADEMSSTFNFDEMGQNVDPENPPNIGEALNNFMSGDNPKKFMNLIGKFGSKLQNDIKSGKVNHQDLLKQSSQMMSGLSTGDMEKQAEQMFGKNSKEVKKIKEKNRGQAARERLQKKLEERKKESSE